MFDQKFSFIDIFCTRKLLFLRVCTIMYKNVQKCTFIALFCAIMGHNCTFIAFSSEEMPIIVQLSPFLRNYEA